MDTSELESILEGNEAVRDTFLGVYALDRLPSKLELDEIQREQEANGLPNRWFLICNCCPSTKIGRHWIAMFSENGLVEFFDSFALPPSAYNDVRLTTFLPEASEGGDVKLMKSIAAIRAKCYSFQMADDAAGDTIKCKGIGKSAVMTQLTHEHYKNCILESQRTFVELSLIHI